MNEKILITDDEPHIRRMLESRLKANGYRVITAENGRIAVEKAKVEKPDLILMDILMPEMSGQEALAKLKADPQTRSIPVIMVTAKGQAEDVEKSSDTGATDFVIKPFTPVILLEKIKSALSEKEK